MGLSIGLHFEFAQHQAWVGFRPPQARNLRRKTVHLYLPQNASEITVDRDYFSNRERVKVTQLVQLPFGPLDARSLLETL